MTNAERIARAIVGTTMFLDTPRGPAGAEILGAEAGASLLVLEVDVSRPGMPYGSGRTVLTFPVKYLPARRQPDWGWLLVDDPDNPRTLLRERLNPLPLTRGLGGISDWDVTYLRDGAERTFPSGTRGWVGKLFGNEWGWSLSCGEDEIDSGVAFSLGDAIKYTERAEAARCGG